MPPVPFRSLARSACLAIWLAAAAVASVRAGSDGEWPQLLGPHRNGVSDETGLNLDWKAKPPKTRWKVPLGSGYSSLAVAGDRLVTTAKRGDRGIVVCLATDDGKELWSYDAAPSYTDKQHQGAGPRSTPTIAGGKVYCLFPRGDLVCLTLAKGDFVWKTNILDASGTKDRVNEVFYWGLSASPLVEGDLVITQPGGDKDNSVVAFHKDTGKMVWGVGADPSGYGSPIVVEANKRRQLVVPTGRSILGVDPVKGDLLWRYEFGNRFDANCATPVWMDDVLVVSAAYGVGCAALEIVADGDKQSVREKWKNNNLQSLMATSIVRDGFVYGCHGDLGSWSLRCLDLKTGEIKWKEKQANRCAFVAADGCLFSIGERGTLQLIELNPDKYVLKGEIPDLLTYKAWAMPALAKKRLYLRDETNVLCLELAKE
jgi:outer membrane protein assembly factor BamB